MSMAASAISDGMLGAIKGKSPQGSEVIMVGGIKSLELWQLGACAVKSIVIKPCQAIT